MTQLLLGMVVGSIAAAVFRFFNVAVYVGIWGGRIRFMSHLLPAVISFVIALLVIRWLDESKAKWCSIVGLAGEAIFFWSYVLVLKTSNSIDVSHYTEIVTIILGLIAQGLLTAGLGYFLANSYAQHEKL
ncbi:MAG TPA: hypothetical protein VNK96_06975 [Fimbriimonadales bacterium]|nr:hypothetical protein [Fimbriimonadales bacterium]